MSYPMFQNLNLQKTLLYNQTKTGSSMAFWRARLRIIR